MTGRQQQRGGEGSQQVQIAGDLVIVEGVTEERAGEIAEARARQVLAEYTSEAAPTARARVDAFDGRLVAHLAELGLLPALGDPSMQILLHKAQIGAASTGREDDYDLLARLMSERAQNSERRHKASIERAVEIVDRVDDRALMGLTAAWFVSQFWPVSGLVGPGIDALERLFSMLPVDELPAGHDWLDHLDILDAIRLSSGLVGMKKWSAYWGERLAGYVAPGLEPAAADTAIADIKAEFNLSLPFVEHELRPGFVRLPFVNETSLRDALVQADDVDPGQIETIIERSRSKGTLGQQHADAVAALAQQMADRATLRQVGAWWDEVGGSSASFQVTGVGSALARSNARRFDTAGLLPKLA